MSGFGKSFFGSLEILLIPESDEKVWKKEI